VYGVYIRFWPTLIATHEMQTDFTVWHVEVLLKPTAIPVTPIRHFNQSICHINVDAHTHWTAISDSEANRYTSHPHQTFQSINQSVISMWMHTHWTAISDSEANRYTSHPHQTFQSINQSVMSMLMLMQTHHGHGLRSVIQKPAATPVTRSIRHFN